MEKASIIEALFSYILFFFILFLNRNVIVSPLSKNKASYPMFTMLCIIYCTYAFLSGDYFHYTILYEDVLIYGNNSHLEYIYNWLINNLPANYNIWRGVVWGSAIVIYMLIFKRLRINSGIAGIAVTLVLLSYFPAPRQSLGFAIMLYGFTFITHPTKNKIYSYLTAIAILYLSTFFHKSMMLYIFIATISFIPFKKNAFILSLLIFPFLYKFVIPSIGSVLEFISNDEKFITSGNIYIESDFRSTTTIWGWVQHFITKVPVILLLGYIIKRMYFKKTLHTAIDKQVKPYTKNAYWLFYLGALFFNQDVSTFLSGRFMDASLYPLTIVFAIEMNRDKVYTKTIKYLIYAFIISNIYTLTYTLFKL